MHTNRKIVSANLLANGTFLKHKLDSSEFVCSWEKLIFTARKRSLGQGSIYTCLSFCSQGGSTWAGTHPRSRYTPRTRYTPDQVHPPTRYTPWTRYTPQTRYTPGPGTPPGSSACWEIRSTSGRYASYWNAFLFHIIFHTPFILK